MSRLHRPFVLSVVLVAAVLLPARSALAFSDVSSSYWDYTAIQYVAVTNTWMADYGTSTFRPRTLEARKYLARTLVNVYAPSTPTDPNITIPDVPKSDPFYRFANVSIKLGWITKYADGKWHPDDAIRVAGFDKAIVLALGLSDDVAGLQNIHQENGTKYTVSADFPYLQLAHILQLHFNHSDETLDIVPNALITRDEVAYSLWWAKTQMTWQLSHAAWFAGGVSLPTLDPSVAIQKSKRDVTQYALGQVGYPYIWAGEWKWATPTGYCCGAQTVGGFDCSGFVWWTEKKYENGYNAAQFRSYGGWSLLERSSSQMAEFTPFHYAYSGLRVGDLMFFSSSGGSTWSSVDHVGIYAGNGWMIHSASSNDGVLLDKAGPGSYYYGIFVYGRRLITASTAPAAPAHPVTPQDLLGGDAT